MKELSWLALTRLQAVFEFSLKLPRMSSLVLLAEHPRLYDDF